MITIPFEPKEKHLEYDWWQMFVEEWDPAKSEKYHIGHKWAFNLIELEAMEVSQLCATYSISELESEALCIFYKMQKHNQGRALLFSRKVWDRDIKPMLESFEKMWEASSFEKILIDTDNLEYIKIKTKDKKLAYSYQGVPMDFIRQAILEKAERDKEKLTDTGSY
ncbi:hypothetical protein GO755_00295 [Spirosoma sp. HMF4905]|uniref:Uncharacterized protein n=1 Tax=Spirosoma arboris TaxID=2682092 RepID=A0A7K1S3S3_9BACT|nr:hypothetical protein [Spirosoma arboris]MVM28450.1 hypothetical protein [Spirosoma arboris]